MSDVPSKEEGNEEEEVDLPLSPIVGYQINSDEENHISESSETDSETEQNLAKANAHLAKIVGALQLDPQPDTPINNLRKRLRRRQRRKMNEELEESISKRQKLETDEDESVQITDNEKTPEKKSQEEFQDSIPPEFFDDNLFKENEALEKEPSPAPPPFFGFRTAGGKEVKISENAILQAKALFSDIDTSKSGSKPTTPAKENPTPEKLPPTKPAPEMPTPVKLTTVPTRSSKKFRVPLKSKVPEREEIRKSITSSSATDKGMSQEVIDSIQALFADDEEFP